jgi:hypothetical protein
MHEFKHGELKRSRSGKGGKVRSRRQAVAIALREAGASKYENKRKNRKNLAKTKQKEAKGETYQQEWEGKSYVGARGRSESSPTMRRQRKTRTATRGRKASSRTSTAARGRKTSGTGTRKARARNGRRTKRA